MQRVAVVYHALDCRPQDERAQSNARTPPYYHGSLHSESVAEVYLFENQGDAVGGKFLVWPETRDIEMKGDKFVISFIHKNGTSARGSPHHAKLVRNGVGSTFEITGVDAPGMATQFLNTGCTELNSVSRRTISAPLRKQPLFH